MLSYSYFDTLLSINQILIRCFASCRFRAYSLTPLEPFDFALNTGVRTHLAGALCTKLITSTRVRHLIGHRESDGRQIDECFQTNNTQNVRSDFLLSTPAFAVRFFAKTLPAVGRCKRRWPWSCAVVRRIGPRKRQFEISVLRGFYYREKS